MSTSAPSQDESGLIRAAAVSYVAATAIGVVMRAVFVGWDTGVPFDHLLHSHSHTLYFGWAALGVLVVGMRLIEPSVWLKGTAVALVGFTLAIFFGFLAVGYQVLTIAISTVTMFAWYLAIWLWWKAARGLVGPGVTIFRAGLGYLVIASLGVWTLAALQASGRGTALSETLAVHAFLLGFGWFLTLSIVGLLVANARELDLSFDEPRVQRAAKWWIATGWAAFPLGVLGGPEVSILGPLSRIAGILLLVPAWIWVQQLWTASPPGPRRLAWRAAAGWFAITALTTAGAALFGSSALSAFGRQGVVIHLHALLVGFISVCLVMLIRPAVQTKLVLAHNGSLAAMLAALLLVVIGLTGIGMWLALLAAVALWVAGIGWAGGITKRAS